MRLHDETDGSHREADQYGEQMGCRRNTPNNTHGIFPLGTTQIRSTRHRRAHKKRDLNSSVLTWSVEDRATQKVMQPGGSLLTPGQHSLRKYASIVGSFRQFGPLLVCHQTSTEKVSRTGVCRFYCRRGRCSPASKRDAPNTALGAARHLELSLPRSCANESQSPRIPGHIERKKDLRNDRFRMGHGRHLANMRSLIANGHCPLCLPRVHLDSGARNTQRSDARSRHGVREFTKRRRPVKSVPSASSTKTHVVCDYTRKLIRTTERRTNLA